MAEAHPVGFRWVMKAKERGATIIHVDPRFSRTSALADIWVPMRAGGDIAFLGGIIRHIIENNLFFRDYVVHFTNDNGAGWCHLAGTSEALAAYAAKSVWSALGVPERMGFSMYNAFHCQASADQTALIGEMVKLAFNGDTTANTNVLNILPNGVQQPVSEWDAMWIDWDMATVLQ